MAYFGATIRQRRIGVVALLTFSVLRQTLSFQQQWRVSAAARSSVCYPPSGQLYCGTSRTRPMAAHVVSEIAPVKALMLTTRWKSDAENLNALGYTPKDSAYTIVQKSSAANLLADMQRTANLLSVVSKSEEGLQANHPSFETLNGLKLLCALGTSNNDGTAIAFYKQGADGGRTTQIDYCMGNIALGSNEVAEEVLVQRIVDEGKRQKVDGGLVERITLRGRVAPSGTNYLPQFCEEMGFHLVDPQPDDDDPRLLYELPM